MRRGPRDPVVAAAIVRAALIELVILALGVFLYFRLNAFWPLAAAFTIGGGVFLLLAAQAGAFERRDDGP